MTADTARGRGIGHIPGSDYTRFIFASMGWSSSRLSARSDDESTGVATILSDDTAKRSRLWGVDPEWFRGQSFENLEPLLSLHDDPHTQGTYLEEHRFTTRSSGGFLNGSASFATRFHNIQPFSPPSPEEASLESEDLCIGVCGVNAAGRSSLINALCGLHPNYTDGPTNPSLLLISHSHIQYFDSRNPQSTVQSRLVWHSIPDPREFPSSSRQCYENIQFEDFDCVIIVTDLEDSETERKIMIQCAKGQVPCLLVYPGHDASSDQLLAVQRNPRIPEAPIAALLDGVYFMSAVRWLMEGCLVVNPAEIRNFMTISGDEAASRETSDTKTFVHDLLMAATWRNARRKPAKKQETGLTGPEDERIAQTEEDPSHDFPQNRHQDSSQQVGRTAMSTLLELPAEQLRNLHLRAETAIQWFFITRRLRGK